MPEVTASQAEWVVEHLRSRDIEVLLNTSLDSAEGNLKLINLPDKTSAGEVEADTLVWAAGVQANPMIRSTDFPLEPRGRVRVLPDLRIAGDEGIVENAWAAGDIAAVPDLTGKGLPDGTCVPNAQHALRQAKKLAKNLWASRWDKPLQDYKHKNLGAVAGFGEWKGVANINLLGRIGLKGGLAWLAHRGYHGMAMPTVERKFRVIFGWILAFFAGRDTTQLIDLDNPRGAFVAAATPAPKPAAAPAPAPVVAEKPAEDKTPVSADAK
jgi:NADH dehydrogenase